MERQMGEFAQVVQQELSRVGSLAPTGEDPSPCDCAGDARIVR